MKTDSFCAAPVALTALALALGLAAAAVRADDAGLRRCRGLVDAAARLVCYDALPLAPQAVAPAAEGARSAAVAPVSPAGPGVAAGAATSVAAPGARAAAVAAAPVPAPAPTTFGLEQQRGRQPEEIASRISGILEGWGPRSKFQLENGQVWQVSDESSAVVYLKSPKVTVQRAMLGGFVMDIEGAPRSPRVRRLE